MVQVPDQAWRDVLDYLLAHEDDIYYGLNDYGKLSYAFASIVGRLPMEMRDCEGK